MNWYLLHTKPRQEKVALLNLEQQGYECYLPILPVEKICHGVLTVSEEPLFPRYLFIYLDSSQSAKSWDPIRYTRGVNKLVRFGVELAKVNECLVETMKTQTSLIQKIPQSLFNPGEKVAIKGPFAGIEAVYLMSDGTCRAMVLIELMSTLMTDTLSAYKSTKSQLNVSAVS